MARKKAETNILSDETVNDAAETNVTEAAATESDASENDMIADDAVETDAAVEGVLDKEPIAESSPEAEPTEEPNGEGVFEHDTALPELTAEPADKSAASAPTAQATGRPRRTRAKAVAQPPEAPTEASATALAALSSGFYNTDFNETDRDLSPDQRREWTAIYASFRSKTPLTGEVIGVDAYTMPIADKETKTVAMKQVLCLVIMDYRVKVIIPQTEIWYNDTDKLPDYVIKRMVGAKLDYVITNVDRNEECAIASRRLALGYNRNRFYRDKQQNAAGKSLICRLLVVGPKRILAECNGFDISISNRDISYTAIADLREEYRTGQELPVKLISCDPKRGTLEVSAKAVNPNPFDGADKRHPVNCTRRAVVSGSYAGGLFCRLADDTNCLCRYSPAYFDTEFFIGDTVLIAVTKFDYMRKRMYGRILSRG